MYHGVIFLDIEQIISKSPVKIIDSMEQKLLSMQQKHYLIVIFSSFPLKMTQHLVGKRLRCAFILYRGNLVVYNERKILSLPISKNVLNEIRDVSKHMKHSLAYYTCNSSLIDGPNAIIYQFQKKFPLEYFKQINRLDKDRAIYQLRIFNSEKRKDILYDTFFEQELACQRQDRYSLLTINKRGNISNAIRVLLKEVTLVNKTNIYYLENQHFVTVKDFSKLLDQEK